MVIFHIRSVYYARDCTHAGNLSCVTVALVVYSGAHSSASWCAQKCQHIFIAIDTLDCRGVFGSANDATCIFRRGFCTSVLFIIECVSFATIVSLQSWFYSKLQHISLLVFNHGHKFALRFCTLVVAFVQVLIIDIVHVKLYTQDSQLLCMLWFGPFSTVVFRFLRGKGFSSYSSK